MQKKRWIRLSNNPQNFYKTLNPYEVTKKQLWANKMQAAMPLWSAFIASVASKLSNLTNDDLPKSLVLLQALQEEANQYIVNALLTDKDYHAALTQAAMLDQAGKAGLDLDTFKQSMKAAMKPKKTKKPKVVKSAKPKRGKKK